MARQRKLNGVGAAEPFELILHADGRLTLHDPATGTKIALESFGSRNIGVFAQLLG
jgi:putative photosynthetic complex assembly protein